MEGHVSYHRLKATACPHDRASGVTDGTPPERTPANFGTQNPGFFPGLWTFYVGKAYSRQPPNIQFSRCYVPSRFPLLAGAFSTGKILPPDDRTVKGDGFPLSPGGGSLHRLISMTGSP